MQTAVALAKGQTAADWLGLVAYRLDVGEIADSEKVSIASEEGTGRNVGFPCREGSP